MGTSENLQEHENQNQDTQTTNTTTIPPKKRGRPTKTSSVQSTTQLEVVPTQSSTATNDTEVEELRIKTEHLEQQLNMYKSIVESISITNTKELITCSDEDINQLYIEYISQNKTEHDKVFIITYDDKTIIPKSYYVIG